MKTATAHSTSTTQCLNHCMQLELGGWKDDNNAILFEIQ